MQHEVSTYWNVELKMRTWEGSTAACSRNCQGGLGLGGFPCSVLAALWPGDIWWALPELLGASLEGVASWRQAWRQCLQGAHQLLCTQGSNGTPGPWLGVPLGEHLDFPPKGIGSGAASLPWSPQFSILGPQPQSELTGVNNQGPKAMEIHGHAHVPGAWLCVRVGPFYQ